MGDPQLPAAAARRAPARVPVPTAAGAVVTASAPAASPLVPRVLRKRRGWTQQRLADEVALQRGTLTRGTIAKIETSMREVSLDETFLLAVALRVSPMHLLWPASGGGSAWLTPAFACDPGTARAWLRGHKPLKRRDEPDFYAAPDDE